MMGSGLSAPIETAEISNYIYSHLEGAQASEFLAFSLRLGNMAIPLTEISSIEELNRLLGAILGTTINYLNLKRTQQLLEALQPRDISREEFSAGYMEVVLDSMSEIQFTNLHWLSERHQRLFLAAKRDKESFESWLRHLISLEDPNQANAYISPFTNDYIQAQLLFASIARILASEEYKPSLSMLVEVFYQKVAQINLIFDTNGYTDFWGQWRSTGVVRLPPRPEPFSEFERDESIISDDDMDRLIEEIHRLRNAD